MNIRCIAVFLILGLSLGIIGIVLKLYASQDFIGDILAISGLVVFTTTIITVALAGVATAVKRCTARTTQAETSSILTQQTLQLQTPGNAVIMPDGMSVSIGPTTASTPVFAPDNSGDMLTIFEDYSQYAPQPRRLFDTHRVTSPAPV